MASVPPKAVVGLVVLLAAVQVAFENVVLFLGASDAGTDGVPGSPATVVAIPLVVSALLLVVLVGGTLVRAETLR